MSEDVADVTSIVNENLTSHCSSSPLDQQVTSGNINSCSHHVSVSSDNNPVSCQHVQCSGDKSVSVSLSPASNSSSSPHVETALPNLGSSS